MAKKRVFMKDLGGLDSAKFQDSLRDYTREELGDEKMNQALTVHGRDCYYDVALAMLLADQNIYKYDINQMAKKLCKKLVELGAFNVSD